MKLALLPLLSLSALAESYPCAPAPELERFHQALHEQPDGEARVRQIRERLAGDPGNLFLHRWYLEFAPADHLATEYRELLDKHPHDAAYLYLYGRAIQKTDPGESVRYMQQALGADPRFPWAHLWVAQHYLAPDAKGEAKAVDSLKAYIQACPYNIDAYSYLRSVTDGEFSAEAARRLRRLLADRTDPQAILLYSTLWQTEFRITPAPEQDDVRRRISEDLARLKKLNATHNRPLVSVLQEGSRLVGEAGSQAVAAPAKASLSMNAAQEVQAWRKEHPYPASGDKAAQQRYGRALQKASEEWIRKYPHEFMPLHERFTALDMLDAPNSEIEAAGDALIRNEDGRASVAGTSVRVHVGQVWLKHGIRVSEIPVIVEKGLERSNQSSADSRLYGWATLAEAYLKLDQPFKAREALDRMHEWLDKNKDSRATTYSTWQARYYERMAELAEKDHNQLDQLTYLERAIATRRMSAGQMEKAHALWKELGGSNEGWLVFSAPPAVSGGTMPPGQPHVSSRVEIGKPLPPLNVKDFDGRTWTLTNFEGKTTLVNLWATWCAPCLKELPYLQKLYDRVKDRAEMQILTLNVDEDIALVQPFLQKNKYSFPVALARSYVKALLPNLSIPRNWIVDRQGALREETVGFGGSGDQWVANALAKLR
jgi:thiol-disulfide isomerase/thioredoxin